MSSSRICSIPGCGKPHLARGWCSAHWTRWKRHGDPLLGGHRRPRRPEGMTLDQVVDFELARARRDDSGCLIAACSTNAQGYPNVRINGRNRSLPRLVLERKLGRPLLPGSYTTREVVRHKCDIRRCIDLDHLIVGTNADNVRDMDERGRRKTVTQHGEQQWKAKLTAADVRQIRRRRAAGEKLASIAEDYGIAEAHVSSIARRVTWKHVD